MLASFEQALKATEGAGGGGGGEINFYKSIR